MFLFSLYFFFNFYVNHNNMVFCNVDFWFNYTQCKQTDTHIHTHTLGEIYKQIIEHNKDIIIKIYFCRYM